MWFALWDGSLVALWYGVVFVFLFRLDAEDSGVAAWSVGVAFTERTEEFGDDGVWFLSVLVEYSTKL